MPVTKFNPFLGLIERLGWLIRLRWIAIIGVGLTILVGKWLLKFSLPLFPLYVITTTIAIYNLIFFLFLIRVKKNKTSNLFSTANRVANLQISLDLFCLILLIHYSGGIENPFIFYFIFHMIIASILLSRRASFLQATFATLSFSSMVCLEYLGILPHFHLERFISSPLYNNPIYVIGVSFVFISTLYIAVYMASSISSRLRRREKKLQVANELLMEKDRIKGEYVLRVTHDIKEHLSAIKHCIEPVTAGITGSLNEKQKNLLYRAGRRTDKVLFFVKSLLEITRIKLSKKMEMENFSFMDMLSDTIKNFSLKAKKKNISVKSSIDPTIDKIRGTKEYLQEAISNILANSFKYTPRNGKVDIIVSDKGNSIFIQIKDTGIGIPKDELSEIFKEFYRASNAKEVEKDGTGLGMSIVKQIIERHKGSVWAESEKGKGSIINIVLPK